MLRERDEKHTGFTVRGKAEDDNFEDIVAAVPTCGDGAIAADRRLTVPMLAALCLRHKLRPRVSRGIFAFDHKTFCEGGGVAFEALYGGAAFVLYTYGLLLALAAEVSNLGEAKGVLTDGGERISFEALVRGTFSRDPRWPEETVGPSRVYFLRDGDHVKIGTSANVPVRIAGGQTMNPRELVLIGSVPGDRRLEADLHRRFRRLHVRGEWFEATPELLAFIDELFASTGRASS